jgi:hypothetical protein
MTQNANAFCAGQPRRVRRMKHIATVLLVLCCGCITHRFSKRAYFPGVQGGGGRHTLNERASEEFRSKLMDKRFIVDILSIKEEYAPIRKEVLKQWSLNVSMYKEPYGFRQGYSFYQQHFDTSLPPRYQPLLHKLRLDIYETIPAIQADFESDPKNIYAPTPEEIREEEEKESFIKSIEDASADVGVPLILERATRFAEDVAALNIKENDDTSPIDRIYLAGSDRWVMAADLVSHFYCTNSTRPLCDIALNNTNVITRYLAIHLLGRYDMDASYDLDTSEVFVDSEIQYVTDTITNVMKTDADAWLRSKAALCLSYSGATNGNTNLSIEVRRALGNSDY